MKSKLLFLMLIVVLCFSTPTFAQEKIEEVHLVYFYPNNSSVNRTEIKKGLEGLVKKVKAFYENEMIRLQFVHKTFDYKPVKFYRGKSSHADYFYTNAAGNKELDMDKVLDEIDANPKFDLSKDIHLIATNLNIDSFCGEGRPVIHHPWLPKRWRNKENRAWAIFQFPQNNLCAQRGLHLDWLIAHELGHAFGLEHDFRTDDNIMSYNTKELSAQTLSTCAAEWLDVCRAFNHQRGIVSGLPIEIWEPHYSSEKTGLHISFKLMTIVRRIHSAQLHVIPTTIPKGFYSQASYRNAAWRGLKKNAKFTLYQCKSLNSRKATIEFVYSEINSVPITDIQLSVIDEHGNLTNKQFEVPNYRPMIKEKIKDMQLTIGKSSTPLDLSTYFHDPNGDTLTYAVQAKNGTVVKIIKNRSKITIESKNMGSTEVTVRAKDPDGLQVSQSFFVNVTARFPDLAIKSVDANKSSLSPGERFRLDTIVKNQGKTASSETTLHFYRSLDRNLSANDTKLHDVRVKQLNAGKQITPWKRFTAPRTPGVYYYIVCVDNIQNETNTGNNCYKPVKITVATSSPDLVVESPRVQKTNLEPGERFRFEVIVRNQGTGESEKTDLLYYLSRNANISDTDIRQRTDRVDPLDPNETGKEWATLTAPDTPGTYYFRACVEDVDGESNTNNNCSEAVRIRVQATQPPGLRIGDAVIAQNTVSNDFNGLLVRKYFGRGSPEKGGVWDGATGIITDGPEKTEDGFTWWKILWNPSDTVRWNDEYALKCKNKPCDGWSVEFFRGSRVIAKQDLAAPPLELVIPKETTLLSNYPNPFNPETWIPYQLSQSAEVSISISAADGKLVRTLALGHQPAGVYHSKSHAAYWDGKNEVGECVASGVYFYTFTTGDFSATRKMLILK